VVPLASPGPHGEARVPNICVEELDDPALDDPALDVPELDDPPLEVPLDCAVVGLDDDVGRLELHAEASVTAATRPTNPTNERLLCFTDPPPVSARSRNFASPR
jgi:hypothetical protein